MEFAASRDSLRLSEAQVMAIPNAARICNNSERDSHGMFNARIYVVK
jgi:hypothetical protein